MSLVTQGAMGMTRTRTGNLPIQAFPIMWGRLFPSICGLNHAAAAVIADTAADGAEGAIEGVFVRHRPTRMPVVCQWAAAGAKYRIPAFHHSASTAR